MYLTMRTVLTSFLFLVTVLSAGESYAEIPNGIIFKNAYPAGKLIRFDSFEKIDWEQFAPSDIRSMNIKSPSKQSLEKLRSQLNRFGDAEIQFNVPMPLQFKKSYYYFISSSGVQPVKIKELTGVARISLDEKSRIKNRVYYGNVFAEIGTAVDTGTGGFIFYSPRPVSIKSGAINIRLEHFLNSATPQMTQEKALAFYEIVTQYRFQIESQEPGFIFVQWGSDSECIEACCQYRFSIYKDDQNYTEIASCNFGCDI